MNRKRRFARLRLEILAAAVISLVFAFALQQAGYYLGVIWVDHITVSENYMGRHAQEMIDSLQTYIDKYKLTEADENAIIAWQKRERVSFSTYDEEKGEITYFYSFSDESPLRVAVDDSDVQLAKENADAYSTLTFADGSQREILMAYDRIYEFYNIAYLSSLVLAAVGYVIMLYLFINRKIAYLKLLSDEVKILEGGSLDYAITIKGKDEIADLARGLNSMRQAILTREAEERQNVKRNRDLVTALSHDIRTPMTSLIGYLEILKMHRYQTEEQEKRYLESAHQKAFQLKEMTDTLFEYSLVSGKTEENYHMQTVAVADFVMSIEETQIADLISDGWQVRKEMRPEDQIGFIRIDTDFYCRILDNLVSNIRKYADKEQELVFASGIQDKCFFLKVTNRVLQGKVLEGSTGVGLKTCQKIMADMQGSLEVKQEGTIFEITLQQPLVWSA